MAENNWTKSFQFVTKSDKNGIPYVVGISEVLRTVIDGQKVEVVKTTDHETDEKEHKITVGGVEVKQADGVEETFSKIEKELEVIPPDPTPPPDDKQAKEIADKIIANPLDASVEAVDSQDSGIKP